MANSILKPTTNEPETKIMDSYIHLNPTYKLLGERYEEKDGKVVEYRRFLKVTLNTGEELILKHLKFSSKDTYKIKLLYREYTVGNILGSLTDGVAKSLNIQEEVEGSDTIIEILMEYGGESLHDIIRNKLKTGDCFKITLQLLNTLTLMEKINISTLRHQTSEYCLG